jgi:hypothetical protein
VKGRGDGARAARLDAAHGHTQMLRLDDHSDALGSELFVQPGPDLRCESLLDLQAAGEHLSDACELGQAEDPPVGKVRDVRDTRERQKMMCAQ